MKKLKIYLETTVFNYYFDEERDAHKATIELFEEIRKNKYEAYTSAYVIRELMKCNEPKRSKMMALLNTYNITLLDTSEEAGKLMQLYIKEEMIPKNSEDDGLHIAVASINNLDLIVSLNFSHINRMKTKDLVILINKRQGYKGITIVSPMEVVESEETR